MSIEMFYPENRPMADRIQQLINDISNMQRFIVDISTQMDTKDARIRPTMDNLMKKYGLKSFSELRDKVLAQLDEETKKKFLKLAEDSKDVQDHFETAWSSSLLITLVSGVGLGTVRIAELFFAGGLYSTTRLIIIGFGKLFTAPAEGARILRAAIKGAGALVEGFEAGSDVGKLFRFAGKIASFLTIVGVVIDSVLVIAAAIEGAKQRDKLHEALNEIVPRRLLTKLYEKKAHTTSMTQGEVISYITLADALPEGKSRDDALKVLSDKFVGDVKTDLAKITQESSYNDLKDQDEKRGSETKFDPSYDKILEYIKNHPEK